MRRALLALALAGCFDDSVRTDPDLRDAAPAADARCGQDAGPADAGGACPLQQDEHAWMTCNDAEDCEGRACGTLDSLFDGRGCLRRQCREDADCGAGLRCYVPSRWGGCHVSGFTCDRSIDDGRCLCIASGDCGGGYCVPAAMYPCGEPPFPEGG